MENFFYGDTFCSDLYDLVELLDIDEENISELPEDWVERVEGSNLEPIFDVTPEMITQLFADANEDRLSEYFDEEKRVIEAFQKSVNFEKLQRLLPKLYYPNGKYFEIKKSDLLDLF